MKKLISGVWVFFGVLGFIGFFSAPMTYYLGEEILTYSLYLGVGSVAILALLAVTTVWVEGAKARPGLLASTFLGIGIAGLFALFLQSQELALLAGSVAVSGLLITGIFVELSRPKISVEH